MPVTLDARTTSVFSSDQGSSGLVGTIASLSTSYNQAFFQQQPSDALIGTVASLSAAYRQVFTQQQPSDGLIGTIASGSTSYRQVFTQQQPSDGLIGTIASGSTSYHQVFTQQQPSDALIGTVASLSAAYRQVFTQQQPSESLVGTIATLNSSLTSTFSSFLPKVYSKENMKNSSTEYDALSATLLMANSTPGNVNNKARFVIDLGSIKNIAQIIVVSGESDSNGNQKLKQMNIYRSSSNYTSSDSQLRDFSGQFGGKIATLTWNASTASRQQQTNIVETR